MRIQFARRAALSVAFCALMAPCVAPCIAMAAAINPPFDAAGVRAVVGKKDNKPFTCDKPPAPMRDLEYYSMYSKKEGNSSVVDPKAYAKYKKAYKPISKFEVGLQDMANRYVRASNDRADIAACDQDWLAQWAKAGALLGKVNKNGEYTRKWLLASISNNWLQIRNEASLDPAKSKVILGWIHQVAKVAMEDFSRDQDLSSRQNNHLYWAAWGIASAAMATGDREMFDWAMDRAKFGIGQIQADGTLPLEVARGQKAYLYHLFAAMPLFMLANAGEKNGVDLFSENNEGLKRLADLCLDSLNDQSYFEKITGKKQDMTRVATPSDMGWLEIYARHYNDPRAAAALDKVRPVKHSRMGGNITLLYAAKVVASPDKDGDDKDGKEKKTSDYNL